MSHGEQRGTECNDCMTYVTPLKFDTNIHSSGQRPFMFFSYTTFLTFYGRASQFNWWLTFDLFTSKSQLFVSELHHLPYMKDKWTAMRNRVLLLKGLRDVCPIVLYSLYPIHTAIRIISHVAPSKAPVPASAFPGGITEPRIYRSLSALWR